MKKYWHELSTEDRNKIEYTNKERLKKYKQPPWCGYPYQEALHLGGCWKLIRGSIKKYEDCKNCKRLLIKTSI